MTPAAYVLYGTQGCHLCDVAEQLLRQLAAARPMRWQGVDIADDEALLSRYGERIPVLLRQDGAELAWPFTLPELMRFCRP